MSKLKLTILFIAINSILMISGCSNRTTVSNDNLYGGAGASFGANGLISYSDGILMYNDYSTGEATVLCSRPECTHEKYDYYANPDPKCPAVSPEGYSISAAFLSKKHLYMITSGDFINKLTVYRSDANGENRKIAGYLKTDKVLDGYHVYNNLLIFTGVEISYRESYDNQFGVEFSNVFSTYVVDLDTMDVMYKDPIGKKDYNVLYHTYKDMLVYIYHDYEKNIHEIRRVDLKTFLPMESILLPLYSEEQYAYVVFNKEYGYYLSSNTDGEAEIVRLELKDARKETILKEIKINGIASVTSVVDDFFFITTDYEDTSSEDNWQNYIYDAKEGYLYEVDMAYSGTETRFMSFFTSADDEHLLLITFENSKRGFRYMRIKDFIARSSQYVDME